MELIQILKALSDETRLRMLNLLKERDLCVCEIEALLTLNQPNASRHLNKLMNAGLVTYYKKAKYVYYKLVDGILSEYPFAKELIFNEAPKLAQCSEDLLRLNDFGEQGITCDMLTKEK